MSSKQAAQDTALNLDQRLTKQRSRQIGLNQSAFVDHLISAENRVRRQYNETVHGSDKPGSRKTKPHS